MHAHSRDQQDIYRFSYTSIQIACQMRQNATYLIILYVITVGYLNTTAESAEKIMNFFFTSKCENFFIIGKFLTVNKKGGIGCNTENTGWGLSGNLKGREKVVSPFPG